ncbi:MAG: UDP-N-acetylmuramate dehydrogenase [Candidatus Omnitrophota bacterium]
MNWRRGLKAKVNKGEPLKNKTSFKIGGEARFFSSVRNENELKELIVASRRYKIPVFILGAGSNILVSDRGVGGLVIKLNSRVFKKVTFNKNLVTVGSGATLSEVIRKASALGLSGLEFLVGIPGTMGGAIIMNAGAWGKDIGNIIEKVKVMDYRGEVKFLDRGKIKFGYRDSGLGSYVILGAVLRLCRDRRANILRRIKENLDLRRNTQDNTKPNAGCVFKNPAGMSAGKLIDLCGLKGKSSGGAAVSLRHANFILNKRNARSRDVLKLMDLIRAKVKRDFDIELKPEIKIWQ